MNKKEKPTKSQMDTKRQLAYTLFTENGFDQKVIASLTGITEKTISSWKSKDKLKGRDWDADRAELRQGFDKERRRIKKMINAILDQAEARETPHNVTTPAEGDTINKLASGAEKLITQLTLQHRKEVGKEFITKMQTTYGQAKAVELMEYWHEYIMLAE